MEAFFGVSGVALRCHVHAAGVASLGQSASTARRVVLVVALSVVCATELGSFFWDCFLLLSVFGLSLPLPQVSLGLGARA